MIETKNKSYKKWMTLITKTQDWFNAPFSENEIVYLRKAVGQCGLKDPVLRADLKRHFYASMPDTGYNITLEHSDKGIKYLRENTYKKNGNTRKNNIFNEFERSVIDDFSHFKFVGLYRQGMSDYVLPLYECVSNSGDSFTYTGNVYSAIVVTDVHSKKLRAVS